MCWDVFSDSCRKKVFTAMSKFTKKAVLVLDLSTCHMKLYDNDRKPVTSWNKKRISKTIIRQGDHKDNWPKEWKKVKTKAQLLEHAREIYPRPKYAIQKITDSICTDKFDFKILFLTVAHPEINAIELVWSIVKRSSAKKSMKFQIFLVEDETRKQIVFITQSRFESSVVHTMKEEEKFGQASSLVDGADTGEVDEGI